MKGWIMILMGFMSFDPAFAAEEGKPETPSAQLSLSSIDNRLDEWGKPITLRGENVKLKWDGQFRYKFEYRDDFDFNDAAFEDDAFYLIRSRLGADLELGPHIRIYAQGQDARSFASQIAHKSEFFSDHLELHQLYAEIKSPWEKVPGSVKVGRQKFSCGDERFISAYETVNPAPHL